MFASKGLERERQRRSARREAERGMSALRARNWRRLPVQGAAGVVIALAANLAWADAGRDPALEASLFEEPTFSLASAAQIALSDSATPQPAPAKTLQASPPR